MTLKYKSVVLLLLGMTLGICGIAGAEAHFASKLDGNQGIPPTGASATGTGCFTLSDEGLHYFLTVEGLTGPITVAHFHSGARGVSGGPLRTIEFDRDNTAIGLWTSTDGEPLTASAITALLNGEIYVNVHTAANPGGEIRGQVDLSAGTFFSANLNGDQENPPVASGGRGTGSFVLSADRKELTYRITVTNLTGPITASHFHLGEIGVNGGVAHNISASFSGNTATGTWSGLTPTNLTDLLAGRFYINVHTAANPGGEIRGQVLLSSGFGLSTQISGAQEVPPVATPGAGSAILTLTPEGLQFDISVAELTGPLSAAHFHRAPPGSNGPPVRTITSEFGGGPTASGLWRADDSEPLTIDMICSLLKGEIYLNIHTAAHPGGEIRGQVGLNTGITTLAATLTGAQTEPPVAVSGTGTANFLLTPAGLRYSITVAGLTGPITAAHIHNGRIGTTGGVEWTLTPDFGGTQTAIGFWGPASAPPLTASLIKELLKGNLYVNIHTGANPGGEIRGQILLASGTGIQGPLTPDQEPGGVASPASGTSTCTLTDNGLVFNVTVDALTGGIVGAHFHSAATGLNGGIARDFTAGVINDHAEGVWQSVDSQPLTPAFVDRLLTGNIYMNFHTPANPGGETRGQLFPSEGFAFGTMLHGANEVPAVITDGTGTASLSLTEQGVIWALSADDLSGPVTAAHFHNAPPGNNGGVVRDISPDFSGSTGRGNWQPNDVSALTPDMICEMLRGNLYLNLHTALHPGGEIRGNMGSRTAATVENQTPGDRPGLVLFQNFPNPFSVSTSVAFRIPQDAHVSLRLFSLDGRELETLVDGDRSAGYHQIRFDPSNLASGTYFYRLETGEITETRKMLIRK